MSSSSSSSSSTSVQFSGPDEILFASCKEGIVDLVDFAINVGANINAKYPGNGKQHRRKNPNKGMTPLMFAADIGHEIVIDKLLSYDDININIKNGNNRYDIQNTTALVFAIQRGHKQIVTKLISNNANVNIKDQFGKTPLIYAIQNNKDRYGYNNNNNNEDIVQILIDNDANINVQDKSGNTPLISASKCQNEEIVTKLIKNNNVNVNVQDRYGRTAFWWSIHNKNDKIAYTLIDNNVDIDIDISNFRRNELAWYAFTIGNKQWIDLRMDYNTALMYAIEYKKERMIKQFLANNNNSNNNRNNILQNKDDSIVVVDDVIMNESSKNIDGNTLLMIALRNGNEQLIDEALSHGANINLQSDYNGMTPLLIALKNENKLLAQKLISRGANVDIPNKHGYTPLMYASTKGYDRIVKQILEEQEKIVAVDVVDIKIEEDDSDINQTLEQEKIVVVC